MKNPDPNHETLISDDLKDECLRYLFGECDAIESDAFEQKLASSSSLGDELLRQADTITLLSLRNPTGSDKVTPSRPSQLQASWYREAVIVATCVCLSWFIFVLQTKSTKDRASSYSKANAVSAQTTEAKNSSEALLIAKAWANDRSQSYDDSAFDDGILVSDDFDLALPSPEAMEEEIDATLSWMFIAVSADLEDANDG